MKQASFTSTKTLDNSDIHRSIRPYTKNNYRMKKRSLSLFFILAIGTFGTLAFAQSKLFKKSIEIGKSKEIKTDIYFFSGELNVNTSTEKLAECTYGYEDGFLKPKMTYKEVGYLGYLAIQSEDQDKGINIDDNSNKWNLNLNKNIKNSISIKLRAGKANINLEDCRLNSFDYKMTAGESNINLRSTSVPQIRFNLLAGEANIDLTGKWHNDGIAEIKGGVGKVTLKVPYNTGVRILVSGVLGQINIPFFHRDGNTYTNDSYGKAKQTLLVTISAGIGQVNVIMEE